MSILIKGMDKETAMRLCSYAGIWMEEEDFIEIPPHGRLIDADALTELVETEFRNWGEDYDASQFLGDIEDAPTIIEAEE